MKSKNLVLVIFIVTVTVNCQQKSGKMATSSSPKSILAIYAHPDDENSAAPILAKYAEEGVEVHLVSVTDGRFGVTEHAGIPAGDSLAAVRLEEFKCAGDELGAESTRILGYPDQLNMQEGFRTYWNVFSEVKNDVVGLFEELKPDVVITWPASGWTGHPDHRLVSSIVTEVFESRDWDKPSALYYPALPTGSLPEEANIPLATIDIKYLTIQVPYNESHLKKAVSAWRCHRSQYTMERIDGMVEILSKAYGGKVFLKPNIPADQVITDLFEKR